MERIGFERRMQFVSDLTRSLLANSEMKTFDWLTCNELLDKAITELRYCQEYSWRKAAAKRIWKAPKILDKNLTSHANFMYQRNAARFGQ